MSARDALKDQLLTLIEGARNSEAARAAISILFPKTKNLLGTEPLDTGEKEGEGRGRKIRQADFAPVYFRLTPNTNLWGKSQLDKLRNIDPDTAFELLSYYIHTSNPSEKRKIRRIIIDFLIEMIKTEKNRDKWLISLLNNYSSLIGNENWKAESIFEYSNDDLIRITLTQAMVTLDLDERVRLLKNAISEASDISLLCELMRSISGDTQASGTAYRPENLGTATQELRTALLDRLRQMANNGVLHKQAQLRDILWYWWGTGNENEVRAYTEQLMETEDGLRVLLEVPISYVRSTAGNYEKIDRRSWNMIVDLQQLEKRALLLQESQQERDRIVADRFLRALDKDRASDF